VWLAATRTPAPLARSVATRTTLDSKRADDDSPGVRVCGPDPVAAAALDIRVAWRTPQDRQGTPTVSTGSQRSSLQRVTGRAVISGHVLKIIRESLPATQEGMAEQLSADVHTVQGWESGRRPLTATSVANLMRLRQRLRHLGARPELLDGLTDAIDADCFLDFVLDTNPELLQPGDHPLATWVMKRSFHQMVAWPVLGTK
jgi:DNA-binding transcriptional regulator YiaG